jgi:sirohydrochlorin ferrochelatase/(2Fe-2S) ferredoxin
MDRTAVLIIGHGSREAGANVEFEALVASFRDSLKADTSMTIDVSHAYIELSRPSVAEGLAQLAASGARRVVALPLFLFAAGHVKNDIPLALDAARRAYPETEFVAARPLGVDPRLAALLQARCAPHLDGANPARTAVIVVGRGSSDPDANADFCKLVRLYGEGRGLQHVLPAFIGITRPQVPEMLDLVARARPDQVVLAPYFLFGGRLIARLNDQAAAFAQQYPWIRTRVASWLGADPTLFELMRERVREALEPGHASASPLACDNCQYRTPLPGREDQVGGLTAMLWSLRHGFTHTQALPHVHAHKPLKKHVLVCGNVDCADRGSPALVESMRRMIKDAGKQQEIKVTRTSCMGRCGEGPTVVVYPDGIWYRGVRPSDAYDLVHEHLLADRLVARLVDNIMQ